MVHLMISRGAGGVAKTPSNSKPSQQSEIQIQKFKIVSPFLPHFRQPFLLLLF